MRAHVLPGGFVIRFERWTLLEDSLTEVGVLTYLRPRGPAENPLERPKPMPSGPVEYTSITLFKSP